MKTGILEVLLVNAKGIRHTNLVGILPLISLLLITFVAYPILTENYYYLFCLMLISMFVCT